MFSDNEVTSEYFFFFIAQIKSYILMFFGYRMNILKI